MIHHVNILEAPWESFWETQDHLFLTSFYALRNNTSLQIENIKALAENGCAGLVFQKGVQNALDPLVIQQAEESGLPLIEVDEATAYPEIITPLVQAIAREKSFMLQRSQDIHRRLTGLILGGDGLTAVSDALHELIDRPVATINSWGDVLTSKSFADINQPEVDRDDLLQEMARSTRQGLAWHKASGRWLAPLLAGEQGMVEGFLLVWDSQKAANQLDLMAIEQAATVASLELAKQRAVLETERRLKRDFIDDMLTGEHHSAEALIARGRSLGWDLLHKRVIMLVDLNQFEAYYLQHLDEGKEHIQHIKQRFLKSVMRVVMNENPLSIVVERSDSIVVIPHFPTELSLSQTQQAMESLAKQIYTNVPKSLNELSISIAIGGFYETVAGLRNSYREANAALEVSNRLDNQTPIIWYENVALYVLLMRFSNQSEVNRWRDQTLGRLIAYDRQNDSELVKTLETYFDANQNSQQAARILFIHPKTLKYRLRRIEEILDTNPFAGDKQLSFYLATKLTKLL
ncbi:MAG: PucR family transcriptional regulator [Chloroflexi bacterium]|nr:MAG: PucR family transcriptional regulator [Chloroflexota bacterium]